MVSRWLGMREMQARRAQAGAKEDAKADRDQRGNREKRKPKKEKPKDAPAGSCYKEQFGKSGDQFECISNAVQSKKAVLNRVLPVPGSELVQHRSSPDYLLQRHRRLFPSEFEADASTN